MQACEQKSRSKNHSEISRNRPRGFLMLLLQNLLRSERTESKEPQRLLSAQFQSHPGPRASWPGLQVPAAASPEPATVPELCHGSQLQSLSEIPGMTAWVTLMPAGVQVAQFQSSSLPSF